jgi:hypothetical protein
MSKRLRRNRDAKPCIDRADLEGARRLYPNLRGIAGHSVKPYEELGDMAPEIRFFTFLRDPAKRYMSHFLNRARVYTREAFDDWVSSPWTQNWQTKVIAGVPDADKAIAMIRARIGFIGLTERFDESLVLLGEWLAEPGFRGQYRRVNQLSLKRRPRDIERERTDTSYLKTEYARRRIAEANAEDQKVYQFVTENVFPRQMAAYQGDLTADVHKLQEQNRAPGRLYEPLWPAFYRNCVYKPLLRMNVL